MHKLLSGDNLLQEQALPASLWFALLQEDIERDSVIARRAVLLSILWQESFLTREGLIARTEAQLGQGCFGKSEADTFGRDIRVLRRLLAQNDYHLKYGRRPGQTGYYIQERPPLAPELAKRIRASMAEVDPRQIAIASRLSPAMRVQQAGQLSDGLRRMAVRRLRNERPGLSLSEAQREVLHRYHTLGG